MKRIPGLLAGALLVGAATVCTGTAPSPTQAVVAKTGTPTTKRPSTVDEQLGFAKAGILARQAKVEGFLSPCMREQGFEYTPVDPTAREAALVGGNLSEEDFEKQFGYGITTLYEQRRQQAAGGPNEKVRDALSPSERRAYDKALLGGADKDTFAVALDNGDFSNLGGCTKKATDAAFGGPGVAESVQVKLDDLDERIKADTRMRAAITSWSSCMRAAGHNLGDPDEVDTTLKDRLQTIVGPAGQASSAPTSEPSYDKVALVELQRYEVALVGEDLRCEKQHITAVETTVRADLESRFRDQNADLLTKVPSP